MLILLDNGVPRGVRSFLPQHEVEEARDRGWDALANGELIEAAESAGFDVLITNDKNIRYQQNLTGRTIALIVLETSQWPRVRLLREEIAAIVGRATLGSFSELSIP